MSPIDPRTREFQEALHQPSSSFFDLPWPWPKSEPPLEGVYNINPTMTPLLRLVAERAQAPCTDWLGMQPEKKPEPGFDKAAHEAFLRSLG